MVELDEARAKARAHLDDYQDEGDEIVLDDEAVIDQPEFWVFFAVSENYRRSGRISDMVIVPPLLVRKADGELFELPTQHPPEHYFEQYR